MKDMIKLDLMKILWQGVDWIFKWFRVGTGLLALVNMTMNLQITLYLEGPGLKS
jgi:hypothetical protein